jgi:hypothetical protein
MHTHRPDQKLTAERPFFGPVRTPQVQQAHGNICRVHTCRCGAVRHTNINAGAAERGPWSDPE